MQCLEQSQQVMQRHVYSCSSLKVSVFHTADTMPLTVKRVWQTCSPTITAFLTYQSMQLKRVFHVSVNKHQVIAFKRCHKAKCLSQLDTHVHASWLT